MNVRYPLYGLFALAVIGSAAADTNNRTANTEVKDHVIVPCLLPARVRKLGGIVYPERRKLTETTAKNCELRGGEYTAYDRARPESAVAFFLPLANDGDPTAQTNLGEVYEYLFEDPKYQDAAAWYRKAADQGDLTAARRLARLYEFGLGVEKDPLLATNLWRKGLGAGEEFVLASELEQVQTAADQRIAALTEALRARNADADALVRTLTAAQSDLEVRKTALKTAESSIAALQRDLRMSSAATNGADAAQVAQLQRDLAERQRTIEDQRFQIQSKEIALDSQKTQLANNLRQTELENDRLKQELERTTARTDTDLKQSKQLLTARSQEAAAIKGRYDELLEQTNVQRRKFDAVVAELATAQAGAATSQAANTRALTLEAERAQQSLALSQAGARAEALQQQLRSAEADARTLQVALDAAAHERELLEAQIATTEAGLVSTRRNLAQANTSLDSLRSEIATLRRERDEWAAQTNRAPAMRAQLAERDRAIAALDAQIKAVDARTRALSSENDRLKEQHSQQVATRAVVDRLPDTSELKLPRGVEIGKNYAFVIGNNDYKNLRPLNFAQNDATRVHDTLKSRYGFQSYLLVNVTAAQILEQFDTLRDTFKPNDSLVIYYAGHGVQDRQMSYWLGVDATAEPSNYRTAALSTQELNRWLESIVVKHVLVVADSCYSGAGISPTGGIKLNTRDVAKQLEFALGGPSRTVISSGGSDPVPDGGAGDGSVFTRTFVDLLHENSGVLTDAEMFAHLKERTGLPGVPTPVFGRIEEGGHVRGQFVFLLNQSQRT